jgi:hypothetical protein
LRSRQRLQAETLRKEDDDEKAEDGGELPLCSSGGLLSAEEGRARFRPAAAGEVGELAVIESCYRNRRGGLPGRLKLRHELDGNKPTADWRLGCPLYVSSLVGLVATGIAFEKKLSTVRG